MNKSELELPDCRVCNSEKAKGFHYGVMTCDACKSFFKRCQLRQNNSCVQTCKNKRRCKVFKGRGSCNACRFQRCIDVGMSSEGIRYGRYTMNHKIDGMINSKDDSRWLLEDEARTTKPEMKYKPQAQNPLPVNQNYVTVVHTDFDYSQEIPSANHNRRKELSPVIERADDNIDLDPQTGEICAKENNAKDEFSESVVTVNENGIVSTNNTIDTNPSKNAGDGHNNDHSYMRDFSDYTSNNDLIDSILYMDAHDPLLLEEDAVEGILQLGRCNDNASAEKNSVSTVSENKMTMSHREVVDHGMNLYQDSNVSDSSNNDNIMHCEIHGKVNMNEVCRYGFLTCTLLRYNQNKDPIVCPSSNSHESSSDNVIMDSPAYLDNLVSAMRKFQPFCDRLSVDQMKSNLRKGYESHMMQTDLFGKLGAISNMDYNAVLESTGIDIDGRQKQIQDHIKQYGHLIVHYVDFAKCIPGFSQLFSCDQSALLKAAKFDFFMLLLHEVFDPELETILGYSGDTYHMGEDSTLMPGNVTRIWIKCTRNIKRMNLNDKELAQIYSLILTLSDRCPLVNKQTVEEVHSRLLENLDSYLSNILNPCDLAKERFSSICNIVSELSHITKSIHEEHMRDVSVSLPDAMNFIFSD